MIIWLTRKLAGASMRSKDLAKASGLAVAFDHTAPTFYRVRIDHLRRFK